MKLSGNIMPLKMASMTVLNPIASTIFMKRLRAD
jgi:hypothetical protein